MPILRELPPYLVRALADGRAIDTTPRPQGRTQAAVTENTGRGKGARKPRPALVQPAFFYDADTTNWVIPIETVSEINQRQWRARSKRSDAAWRAVSRAFGPWLRHAGEFARAFHHQAATVRCRLVRLGGRKLDRSNLPTALKAVEDAVAFILGVDDGDKRWLPEWDQEPGGEVGVKVSLSIIAARSLADVAAALDGKSRGTSNMIETMRKLGKPVFIFEVK